MHRSTTYKTLNIAITGAIAALAAANTQAVQLEEVVVTAEKRSESLQDVPVAVSAFSADDLLNAGVNGTQALQASTPGLVYNNTGPTAQPYLRGIGTRLALNGLESSIATYIDDRYVARSTAAMMDFADIERVEVLKGPQGTLYGRNATGGAIRVISKDVSDELEGSLKLSAGNFDSYSASGTVSIPLTDDFGVRLTALTKKRDGYADNLDSRGSSELDNLDYQAFRTKFRWDMTEATTARLDLNYWTREDNAGNEQIDVTPGNLNSGTFLANAAGDTATGIDTDEAATQIDGENDGNEFSAQLRFDSTLGSVDFVSITTYTDYELDWVHDGDGTSSRRLDVYHFEESEMFSQEFQLLSDNDSGTRWILGAYYFTDEHEFEATIDVADLGLPLLSMSPQTAETTSWALFGQMSWDLTDATSLTLGGRYTKEKKEVEGRASSRAPINLAVLPQDLEKEWNEFTPKVTLDHHLTQNAMLYLTYARGFKSGGYNYPAVPAPGAEALEPEILDMLELGLKSELFDRSLRLNASIFQYDYKDLQVTRAAASTGGGAIVTTENAADAEIMGLDIDLTWLPLENLTLNLGLNYLDSEYEDYAANAKNFKVPGIVASSIAETGMVNFSYDASGDDLLRSPKLSAFVSAEYVVTLQGATMPLYLAYSYKDDYKFDFVIDPRTSVLEQDSYGLLNARVSYIPDNADWSLALWGSNLSDEEYYADVVANGTGIRAGWGIPRTYGIDLNYQF